MLSQKQKTMCLNLTSKTTSNAVKSFKCSLQYARTIIQSTLVNIIYHRIGMNESDFVTKQFYSAKYKQFKRNSKDPILSHLKTVLFALDDALKNKYLKEINLFLVSKSNKDILEYYKLSLSYSDEGSSSDNKYMEEVAEELDNATTDYLRNLESLGGYSKLEDCDYEVEIRYFNGTPRDYEPPGFAALCPYESRKNEIDKKRSSVYLGTVKTGFHSIKCRARGEMYELHDASNQQLVAVEDEQVEDVDIVEEEREINIVEAESEINKLKAPNGIIQFQNFTEDYSQYTEELKTNNWRVSSPFNDTLFSTEVDEGVKNCTCKVGDIADALIGVLKCENCEEVYHAPCQGYLQQTKETLSAFTCSFCRKDETPPQSNFVNSFSMTLSQLRYLFWCIYHFGAIPEQVLEHFAEAVPIVQKFPRKDHEKILQNLFFDKDIDFLKFGHRFEAYLSTLDNNTRKS